MRCLIRESKVYSGDYLEVDMFPVRKVTSRRNAKAKPSSEAQKRLNEKNARKSLTWLVQENFGTNDFMCELSYPKDFDYSKAITGKEFDNFLRAMRREYQKAGLEFRYVYSVELGEKNKRPHYHLICSGDLGSQLIESKWNKRFSKNAKKNYVHTSRLKFTRTGLAGAAFYITKDPLLTYRSYCCSKNLKRPQAKKRDGRISSKLLAELRKEIYNAEMFEKLYPGYEFVDANKYLDLWDIDGYGEAQEIEFPYLTVRLFRKDSKYILRDLERANYEKAYPT